MQQACPSPVGAGDDGGADGAGSAGCGGAGGVCRRDIQKGSIPKLFLQNPKRIFLGKTKI